MRNPLLPNYFTTVFTITHALEVMHIFVLVWWKNYIMGRHNASLPDSVSSDVTPVVTRE